MNEADVFRLLDRWLAAQTPSAEPMTGVVDGVPDTSRFMLVRIGDATIPIPVWRPALPTLPVSGERVSLIRGPEGYLVVDKVLDRDPPDPILPGGNDGEEAGSAHSHTLGLHTALGLAQLSDITSHAESASHLITYTTPNTLTTGDGKWSKLGEGAVLEQFGSVTFQFFVNGGGSMASTWTRGQVRGKVLQLAEFGNDPEVTLELLDFADIDGADLSLVVLDNAGPTTFELYARVTREYEWLSWTPIYTRRDRCQWDWTGCQAFIAALP